MCSKRLLEILMGVTTCRGTKYTWGIKFCDFQPITRYITQMMQDIAMVTIEGE